MVYQYVDNSNVLNEEQYGRCRVVAVFGDAAAIKRLPGVITGGSSVLISTSGAYVGSNGVLTITRAGGENVASNTLLTECKKI